MEDSPKTRLIAAWVKTQVSPRRFAHIQGVVKSSGDLALRFGQSVLKARLAAWLHDSAKELPKPEMTAWLKGTPFHLDAEEKAMPGLWHPHAGAAIALKKWKIKDPEVLEAIRCHTLGGEKMGGLARVVFVADFVEPGRHFDGVAEARRAARRSLIQGVRVKAERTLADLLRGQMMIHPRLLNTWNAFLLKDDK
jgi:predicted HD superfamily hydrolase involved in NAD metabolism